MIYQHTFSVLGTGVSNAGFKIVPVKMTDNASYNDAQPYVATGDAATSIISKVKRYSTSGSDPF